MADHSFQMCVVFRTKADGGIYVKALCAKVYFIFLFIYIYIYIMQLGEKSVSHCHTLHFHLMEGHSAHGAAT